MSKIFSTTVKAVLNTATIMKPFGYLDAGFRGSEED